MSQRETNLIWLKDLLEHLRGCEQQLEWTEDAPTVQLITETMLRDLESCRKICKSMQRRAANQDAA